MSVQFVIALCQWGIDGFQLRLLNAFKLYVLQMYILLFQIFVLKLNFSAIYFIL